MNILQPGPGVGGHCIAVDPWFIVASDAENSKLIRTARHVNDAKPQWVIEKVKEAVAETNTSKVAVLGLAFKADIDDLRESPALNIAVDLAEELENIQFLVAEPNVNELPKRLQGFDNAVLRHYSEAISESDVILLLVDHKEFKGFSSADFAGKSVVDTKGLWV